MFGLDEIVLTPPIIDSATGKDVNTITLVWEPVDGVQRFELERTDPNSVVALIDAPSSPFDDIGLEPATTYAYRVRGVFNNGDTSDWSASVAGTTLAFVPAYAKTLSDPSPGWAGYTLVQRIEAAYLGATGPHVRITVEAASDSDASIDRIYISQADSAGKPYDSAADLTAVYDLAANQQQPFVVPAGTTKSLPIVAYTINKFQALLIAVDFSSAPASGTKAARLIPTSEAANYNLAPPGGEAAARTRSPNYQQGGDIAMMTSNVILITKIEVG